MCFKCRCCPRPHRGYYLICGIFAFSLLWNPNRFWILKLPGFWLRGCGPGCVSCCQRPFWGLGGSTGAFDSRGRARNLVSSWFLSSQCLFSHLGLSWVLLAEGPRLRLGQGKLRCSSISGLNLKGEIFFFLWIIRKRNQKEVCDQGEEIRVCKLRESPPFWLLGDRSSVQCFTWLAPRLRVPANRGSLFAIPC